MEVIKYLDLFGTTFHFFIENHRKYYTIYGGILSFFLIIILITLSFFFSKEHFLRENPIISFSSLIPSNKTKLIKHEENKLYIPWRLTNYSMKSLSIDNIFFPIILYKRVIKDSYSGKIFQNKIINYMRCSETDMSKIDKNIFKIDVDLNELYCFEIDEVELGGGWNSDKIQYIQFEILLCEGENSSAIPGNNCTSLEQLKLLGLDKGLFFQFFYPIVHVQYNNLSNPMKIYYEQHFYKLNLHTNKIQNLFIQENILEDDLGWIIKKNKNYSIWGTAALESDSNYLNLNEDKIEPKLYSLNIFLSKSSKLYIRKYKKLYEIFSDIYPILVIIFYIFKFFAKLINKSKANKKLIGYLFETPKRRCESADFNNANNKYLGSAIKVSKNKNKNLTNSNVLKNLNKKRYSITPWPYNRKEDSNLRSPNGRIKGKVSTDFGYVHCRSLLKQGSITRTPNIKINSRLNDTPIAPFYLKIEPEFENQNGNKPDTNSEHNNINNSISNSNFKLSPKSNNLKLFLSNKLKFINVNKNNKSCKVISQYTQYNTLARRKKSLKNSKHHSQKYSFSRSGIRTQTNTNNGTTSYQESRQISGLKYVQNFPYRYYFYSICIKNLDINKCQKLFSKQYIKCYISVFELFDAKKYIVLQRQFKAIKSLFIKEQQQNELNNDTQFHEGIYIKSKSKN